MNILLYDQDQTLHTPLQEMGYAAHSFSQLHDLVDHTQFMDFDAIILVARTHHQGFVDAIHEVRKLGIRSPCVFVGPALDTHERTLLFKRGVDGITTPLSGGVHLPELQAILHSFIARYRRLEGSKIVLGNTTIDLGAQQVFVDDQWFHCTHAEYRILELLATRREVVSKARILDYLYAGRDTPGDTIINVFICKLRRRLRLALAEVTFKNDWGKGYALILCEPGATEFHAPKIHWRKQNISEKVCDSLIQHLSKGTSRFPALAAIHPTYHVNSIRHALLNLRTLIVSRRMGQHCEYSLSEEGEAYALHKGWIKGEAGVDTSVPM